MEIGKRSLVGFGESKVISNGSCDVLTCIDNAVYLVLDAGKVLNLSQVNTY